MKKIAILDNIVQAQLLEGLLKEKGIPHVMRSYHCSAYDGLFQFQQGWGHVEAPEEHQAEILELIESLKSENEMDTP